MKRITQSIAILFLLTAAACTQLRPVDPAPDEYWVKPMRPLSRGESLLLYFDYARGLSATEFGRESEALRQQHATDKSEFTRLRYALLLSLPNAGAKDHARAQQLLDPLTRDAPGRDPALRALANLLATELAERRKFEDNLQVAVQRQKDEASERRRLDESLQAATQRQKDEQARAADLEQKLEALKSIERTLNQRDRKAATRAPAPTLPPPGSANK